MIKNIILTCIRFYRLFSGFFCLLTNSGGCRFSPSCSDYAYQAINKYGILKGIRLAGNRIWRCNHLLPGKTSFKKRKQAL